MLVEGRGPQPNDNAPVLGRCLLAGPDPVADKCLFSQKLCPLLEGLFSLAATDDAFCLASAQGIPYIFLPFSGDLGNVPASGCLKDRAHLVD